MREEGERERGVGPFHEGDQEGGVGEGNLVERLDEVVQFMIRAHLLFFFSSFNKIGWCVKKREKEVKVCTRCVWETNCTRKSRFPIFHFLSQFPIYRQNNKFLLHFQLFYFLIFSYFSPIIL